MYSRRSFLGRSLEVAAAAVLGVPALPGAPAFAKKRSERPNVLFIGVDDLNDWVGCLGGHPDTRTPHIDRLAARGLRFTRAYCNAPACNPSRASMLTGIRPSTSGVYTNRQPFRWAMPDAVTLQQHLMAHGYEVIGRGKIFHGHYPDPPSWHEYVRAGKDPKPPNPPLNGIPDTAHFDWGPLDVSEEEMDDRKVVRWCAEQLRKRRDKPLFLACGLNGPHLPWYVPRKYFDMFPPERVALPPVKKHDLDDVPPQGRRFARPERDHKPVTETHNWHAAVASYLASVAFTDTNVGLLMEAFDASPYRDDTLILFWGDQGWHLGEKLHWRKFTLWEEATRVPMFFAVPGVTQSETSCGRTVSFIDIYPTLIDLCGLPLRPELEGVSLHPLLKDPTAAWDRPALTTHEWNNHSLRSERWRYIRYHDGTEELYDHDHDPHEWTNLAGRDEHAQVKRRLATWLPQVNAPNSKREKKSVG
jgi:arylsulfatase A-like enzyme